MGLEDTPKSVVRTVPGCLQGGGNLCGMVGIVINNGDAADGSLILKASVGSAEIVQGSFADFSVDTQIIGNRTGGQGRS